MNLTPSQQVAYRMFGGYARERVRANPRLRMNLAKAHRPEAPEVFLAFLYALTTLALLEGLLVAVLVLAVLPAGGLEAPLPLAIVAGLSPVLLPAMVYAVGLLWPELRASDRQAAIDRLLPGALNYMAAMASSGMTPERILGSLARQDVYGEVADEARWIDAEIRFAGRDLLSALSRAVPRSPSAKLQDVWQGMSATITSGASLKSYLLSKAEQMHRDNASMQRQNIETLGILAESFLVVAVAAPVFLIIMLTVMGAAGPAAMSARSILWILVLVLLPAAQGGFAFAVLSMRGKV